MPEQQSIVSGTVNVQNGIATLTVNEVLQPGTYTITGTYNQNNHYQGSSDTAELEVLKKTTTTTISTNKNEYLIGENITLGVIIKQGTTPITDGVFSIYIDNTLLQSNVAITGQITAIQLNELSTTASSKSIQVIYQGTATYNASTSNTKTIQVNKHASVIDSIQVKLHSDSESIIKAQILNSSGNPITTGTVHAKLGGQNITDDEDNVIMVTPDEDGIIEIIPYLYGLTSGSSYQVQLNYSGTEYYSSATETVVVTAIDTPVITGFTEEEGICGYFNYTQEESALLLSITSTIPQDVIYEEIECVPVLNKMPLIIEYTDINGNTILFSIEGAVTSGFQGTVGIISRTLFYEDGEYIAIMEEDALNLLLYLPELLISYPPASINVYLDDDSFTPSVVEVLPYLQDPAEGYFDISNWGTYPSSASGSSLTTTPTPATTSDMVIDTANNEITVRNNKYIVYSCTMKDFFDYSEEFSVIIKKGNGDGRFELGFVNTTNGGYKVCYSGDPIHLMNNETNFDLNLNSDPNRGAVLYNYYSEFTLKLVGTDLHWYYCQKGTTFVDKVIPLGNIDMSKYYFYMRAQVRTDLHFTTNKSKINYPSRQQ